mmetsp:Transcript_16199/g.27665  ORF Transcript_16199/g.27665 Transcript_16199/m.27665 type:complete len:123 (-) Transcript_16199:944-1312(-)
MNLFNLCNKIIIHLQQLFPTTKSLSMCIFEEVHSSSIILNLCNIWKSKQAITCIEIGNRVLATQKPILKRQTPASLILSIFDSSLGIGQIITQNAMRTRWHYSKRIGRIEIHVVHGLMMMMT